ncbi:MAG: hypothetical protein IIC96_18260, partial [Chloroflexi bacterium]|nr:hypothetical protein [Chloroflexota bacterium]
TPDPSPSGRGETEGRGEGDSWTIRIPEGVREVIGRRLNRLSQRCNETLTVASILGREFTMSQLRPLVEEVTEDRLFELLEEALASRLIEELPQSVGRYQFTHALIQETLAEELSTTRRVRLHARIANVLEELYGADAEAHAPELAFHYSEAANVTGPDKLVHYSLLAGERALAGYAWDEALVHFQRGLAAKGVTLSGLDPAEDAETADLLFGLGRARASTLERSEIQEAVDTMTRSFNYYAASEDVARAVAVAEYPIRPEPGNPTGWGRFLARALTLVEADSHEAARLLSRYGWILCQEQGEYQESQDSFNKALSIARREGDLRLEISTLASAAYADMYFVQFPECLEKCLRVIEMTQGTDDPYSETIAHYLAVTALVHAGDAEGAGIHAEAMLNSADRLRDRIMLSLSFWTNHIVNIVQGNWTAAREFGDRGVAVSPTDPRLSFNRISMQYELGEFEPSLAELERLPMAWDGAYMAGLIPIVSFITGNADGLDAPAAAGQTVLSSPTTVPIIAIVASTGLAFVAVLRHDASAAREQYTRLAPQKGTMLFPTLKAADRLLGLLAFTMGDLHLAAGHFEDSLSFCRRSGLQPELAWTCCDYADLLLEQDGEGDRAKAMSLLDESLAISSELGMRPLMERVLSRREILGA